MPELSKNGKYLRHVKFIVFRPSCDPGAPMWVAGPVGEIPGSGVVIELTFGTPQKSSQTRRNLEYLLNHEQLKPSSYTSGHAAIIDCMVYRSVNGQIHIVAEHGVVSGNGLHLCPGKTTKSFAWLAVMLADAVGDMVTLNQWEALEGQCFHDVLGDIKRIGWGATRQALLEEKERAETETLYQDLSGGRGRTHSRGMPDDEAICGLWDTGG